MLNMMMIIKATVDSDISPMLLYSRYDRKKGNFSSSFKSLWIETGPKMYTRT